MQNNEGTISVLHITDCHLNEDRSKDLLGVNTFDSLMAVLGDIKASGKKPDCVLVTGDIAQDGSIAAYETMKEALQDYDCPIRWFPGNHDNRLNMAKVVSRDAELEQVTEIGGWQLVLLDSLSPGNVYGTLAKPELDVLESALEKSSVSTLVCLHHQPVDIHSKWLDRIGLRDPEQFLEIVDKHDHVKGVLWGHIHQEYDVLRDQKRMLATPSTCIQFKPKSDDFALDECAPGYRWLTLKVDGDIETAVHRAETFEFELDLKSNGY